MKKLKWYFKNGACFELFTVIYENADYILVMNDDTKKYSFGLRRDFGTLYGFPVNQSCLTYQEVIKQLNAFIKIDTRYLPDLGEIAQHNIDRWQDMINSVKRQKAAK